jgi:hypothetical protein
MFPPPENDAPALVGRHVAGPAFDAGEPVATSDPVFSEAPEATAMDVGRLRREGCCIALDVLAAGATSPEAIGRRVLIMAHLLGTDHGPRTQRELAARMGLSVGRVNAILACRGAVLEGFAHALGEQGSQLCE